MKKRIWALALLFSIVMTAAVGCGNQVSVIEPTKQSLAEEVVAGETETEEVVPALDYAYEQELNIIDDNYRNYYEIFVYSFYDSDGDGIGDLNGVTEKLDYISDMGFNGIWFMPIMPSPTYHKYDVVDYLSIDEEYGTLEDFTNLVQKAHEKGIRITIDFVLNHSSSKHPWFKEACAYLRELPEDEEPNLEECPYVGYYNFSREKESGSYYQVPGVAWYYEGSFWSEMPDLNLKNEALQHEIEEIAKFWIDQGVDGFRMDAAMHFEEGDTTVNNELLNWLYSYCKSLNPDFYMVSEVWAAKATIANYYESLTPSMFNFAASSVEGVLEKTAMGTSNARKLVDAMLDYQTTYSAMNPDYIDAVFLTNHDQVRVANNLQSNPTNLKMAAGLLSMMSGNTFVYYGEEIGMKSGGNADENKRLAMYWSAEDKTGIPNGPKDADKKIVPTLPALDEQEKDPFSLLNYYKRAMRIRNENPEIARGTIEIIESLSDDHLAAITKTYDNSIIGIVYNTSEEDKEISLKDTNLAQMGIRGYLTPEGELVTLNEGVLFLPAKSICVLK